MSARGSRATPLVKQLQRSASRASGRSAVSTLRLPSSRGSARGSYMPPPSPIASVRSAGGSRDPLLSGARSLSRRLFANYHRLQEMFVSCDPAGKGIVSYPQFRAALKRVGVKLPKKEFVRILNMYDPGDSGNINYRDFTKRLASLIHPSKTGEVTVTPFSEKVNKAGSGPPRTPTLAGRLESKVAAQSMLGFDRIGAAFRRRDPLRTGKLSVEQFMDALDEAGHRLSDDEEKYILHKFCVADGMVPLDLFSSIMVRDLKPKLPDRAPNRPVSARAVQRLFAHKMFTRFRTVKRAFRIFDEDHSGDVSHVEFRQGLATLGFVMTDDEFTKFVRDYDKKNTGTVTYEMFNDTIGDFIQPRPTDGIFLAERPVTPRLADWVEPMFLQKALVQNGLPIDALDRYFDEILDPIASGSILPARLVKAVHDIGISGVEAEYLAELYPRDKRGRITRDAFLHRAMEQVEKPAHPSYERRPELFKVLKATTQTCEAVERLFANSMFSRYRTVLAAFRQFDEDHNGTVSKSEFRAALASMGFHMTDFEFHKFFRLFSPETDEITFQKFQDTVGEARDKFRINPNIVYAFLDSKSDGGYVTAPTAVEALAKFHVELDRNEEKKFLLTLDREQTGRIPVSELHKLIEAGFMMPPESVPKGYLSDDDETEETKRDSMARHMARTKASRPSTAGAGVPRLPRLGATGTMAKRPASRGSGRPRTSSGSARRTATGRSSTTTARERRMQLSMLQKTLEDRGAAESKLANAAPKHVLKQAYGAMRKRDARCSSFLPVKAFKAVLGAKGIALENEDVKNLVSQYGDASGRNINYVTLMRQAYAARATHRAVHTPASVSRLQSARMLQSMSSPSLLG